jgi:hypothetical protein
MALHLLLRHRQFRPFSERDAMTSTRTSRLTAIRLLLLSVSVLFGVAGAAQASTLTLNFSGNVDLSASGGPAVNPFSGFFTWDPNKTPSEVDPDAAEYGVEAYQMIFNGVDKTLGLPGNAGIFVINDADPFGTGTNVDALLFVSVIEKNAVTGDKLLALAFTGPTSAFSTLSLPADYSFLSLLPTHFSFLSLEVPGEGDANDRILGTGFFAATPVPEPATLTLTALGLAGAITRARRGRQRDR